MQRFICRIAASLFVLSGCASPAGTTGSRPELKIATWNLEWFMNPRRFARSRPPARPPMRHATGARRSIPCDVAHELARSGEDIAAMRGTRATLDADVSLAGSRWRGCRAAAVPDHEFCFSRRVAVQNNGFAIRRGCRFACGPDSRPLSWIDDVRRGVELRLFPGTPRAATAVRAPEVRLRARCARFDAPELRRTARQVPVLEQWIDAQASGHRPFAVLGDFNRDLRVSPPDLTLGRDRRPRPTRRGPRQYRRGTDFPELHAPADLQRLHRLHRLGRQMARGLVPNSFGRELYRPRDALRRKLSDHCPVFIRLGWQTPPRRRKPHVKFFAKPIKFSSVQKTRLAGQ
jgi:hypothetical protein